MASSISLQRLDLALRRAACRRLQARDAAREARRLAAERRAVLARAGFAAADIALVLSAADAAGLPAPLKAAIAEHLAAALASQRRMARRRDARYDLTRHIFLSRFAAWLEGAAAPARSPAETERLPGAVLNRTPHRRSRTRSAPAAPGVRLGMERANPA